MGTSAAMAAVAADMASPRVTTPSDMRTTRGEASVGSSAKARRKPAAMSVPSRATLAC